MGTLLVNGSWVALSYDQITIQDLFSGLERETGFEPATNSLEGYDSTTELLPLPLRIVHYLQFTGFTQAQPPAIPQERIEPGLCINSLLHRRRLHLSEVKKSLVLTVLRSLRALSGRRFRRFVTRTYA